MRKPLIVANWKMHKTVPEAVDLVEELLGEIGGVAEVEVALAPPYTALEAVGRIIEGRNLFLCSQNMHWETEGPFTGEISPFMLRDLACRFVILGHSERRQFFSEGEGEIGRKFGTAVLEGLVPILCVGETLGERDYGRTYEIIERQIRGALEGGPVDQGKDFVVAYEPVWAVGTGKTASPEAAQEVHGFIRGLLDNLFGPVIAERARILYGGSVKPGNIDGLMAMEDIDGALVGGASLSVESFSRIVLYRKS